MSDAAPFDPVRHRRGGRRPKAAAERRDVFIRVRVTTGQLAAITARAAAAGLSLADYGRAALDGKAVQVTVSRTAPPEVLRQLRIMGGNLRQALEEGRRGNFGDPATEAALTDAARVVAAELRRLLHAPEF